MVPWCNRAIVAASETDKYSLSEVVVVVALDAADSASAAILKVRQGEPLLAVERVTYTYGARPVEWRLGLCTTRRHFYLNELG